MMRSLSRIVAGNWSVGVAFASRSPNYAISFSSARLLRVFGPVSRKDDRGLVVSSSTSSALEVDRDAKFQSDEGATMEESHSTLRKKKVAIWVGYVGTGFKAIEYELQRAIFEAGGILESNYGSLEKVNWSRSSRTDKGVHSLSTVITMKMEIPPSAWFRDSSGLVLADDINMRLPPSIQVFGLVPVTKSFDARRFCCSRTYQYLLPASMLGLSQNSSPETIASVLEKFRSILRMFQGRFAFHNYTIRRFYRADFKAKHSPKAYRARREKDAPKDVAPVHSDFSPSSEVPLEEGSVAEVFPVAVEGSPVGATPIEDESSAAEIVGDDVELNLGPEEMSAVADKKMQMKDPDRTMAYWLDVPDVGDKISASHFRRILDCSCGGLENSNSVQFVRISITGESFMVHQIRKMVATAVAVLKELLPGDIIPISLCRHSRITLPLAPPDGLVLAKNSFFPYRQLLTPAVEREFRDSEVGLSRLKSLPKLEISPEMSERADMFWRDVLLPELAPQLDGSLPLWSAWQEKLIMGSISDDELETVRSRYTKWREDGLQRVAETKASIDSGTFLSTDC